MVTGYYDIILLGVSPSEPFPRPAKSMMGAVLFYTTLFKIMRMYAFFDTPIDFDLSLIFLSIVAVNRNVVDNLVFNTITS